MRSRRRQRPGGMLPASMLDLIWILLFFFLMISTVRKQEELEALVDRVPLLGDGENRDATVDRASILHIHADGRLVLDDVAVRPEDLAAQIARVRSVGGDRRLLIIDVDRDARVEDLLHAEDVARGVGMECVVRRRVAAVKESGR